MDNGEPNQQHSDLADPLKELELNYRHAHPVAWWMALVGPIVLTLAILGLIYVIQGPKVASSYIGAALAAFFAFGRFIILLGTNEPDPEGMFFLKHLDARNLFAMLTYLDVMVAMFVAFHMGILFRIPFLGPKIASMVSDGQFILRKQPWIRRAAFIGLVGFVIFPTSTTGSVGGSIFGRILGMKRWRVVGAILTGSLLGNGLMLMFSTTISKYMNNDSWMLRVVGVVAMLVALFIFERNIRRLKDQYEEQDRVALESANRDKEVPYQAPPHPDDKELGK